MHSATSPSYNTTVRSTGTVPVGLVTTSPLRRSPGGDRASAAGVGVPLPSSSSTHSGVGARERIGGADLMTTAMPPTAPAVVTAATGGVSGTPGIQAFATSRLQLELEHRMSEIHLKQKTINKLESEMLSQIKQKEEDKARCEERVQQLTLQHRKETERLTRTLEEIQAQLGAEKEAREVLRLRLMDSESELKSFSRIEDRLRENERLLEDRQQRTEELKHERRIAEETILELKRNDQSKVLEGRLQAQERLVDHAQFRIKELGQTILDQENTITALKETIGDREEELIAQKHIVGQKEVSISALETELESWPHKLLQVETLFADERDRALALEQKGRLREDELQRVVDALREELRAESRSRDRLELLLAEADSSANVLKGQCQGHEQTLERTLSVQRLLEERLQSCQRSNDEKDSALAKEEVLNRSLKSECEQLKAVSNALRTEVNSVSGSLKRAVEDRDRCDLEVARLSGLEEKYAVLKDVLRRQGEDYGNSATALNQTKERLAEAEDLIHRLDSLHEELRATKREVHVKGEAVDIAVKEKQALRAELEEMTSKAQTAANEQKVTESKLNVEVDRRRDLEKRLFSLESGFVGDHSIHGRYESLKGYLQGTGSDAARAQQLSLALLDEVKVLEGRLADSEKNMERLREEKRKLEIRNTELEVQFPSLLEGKEQLSLVSADLERANERVFQHKKDALDLKIAKERILRLEKQHASEDAELQELRGQLAALRATHHSLQSELERQKTQREELEIAWQGEVKGREEDREVFLSVQRVQQRAAADGSPAGASSANVELLAVQEMLTDEIHRHKETIHRLHMFASSGAMGDGSGAGGPGPGPVERTGMRGTSLPIGSPSSPKASRPSSPPRSPTAAIATRHRSVARQQAAEQIEQQQQQIYRLESQLQSEKERFLDQQRRVGGLSSELKAAMIEMAAYREERERDREDMAAALLLAQEDELQQRTVRQPGRTPSGNNSDRRLGTPRQAKAPSSPVVGGRKGSPVSKAPPPSLRRLPSAPVLGAGRRAVYQDPLTAAKATPPPNIRREVPVPEASTTTPGKSPAALEKENEELTQQLSDARLRLAEILRSPRPGGAPPPLGAAPIRSYSFGSGSVQAATPPASPKEQQQRMLFPTGGEEKQQRMLFPTGGEEKQKKKKMAPIAPTLQVPPSSPPPPPPPGASGIVYYGNGAKKDTSARSLAQEEQPTSTSRSKDEVTPVAIMSPPRPF